MSPSPSGPPGWRCAIGVWWTCSAGAYPDVDGLYTFWDYQAGRFHKRQGMRIDHVLTTETLAGRAGGIVVDRNARKGTKPSDHAPLVVDFDLERRDQ